MIELVRHGRTDANASGLLLGRLDPPLDSTGERQAAEVADALAGRDIARIVTSPLARTRATAQRIAAATGASVVVDDRWLELDYGELDGVPLSEVPLDVWATWQADVTFTPPGGESLVALGKRVRAALDELREEAMSADIVVVSHVSPIKAAVAWALGVGDEVAWRLFLAPASITTIACTHRGASLHAFNVVTHHTAGS